MTKVRIEFDNGDVNSWNTGKADDNIEELLSNIAEAKREDKLVGIVTIKNGKKVDKRRLKRTVKYEIV